MTAGRHAGAFFGFFKRHYRRVKSNARSRTIGDAHFELAVMRCAGVVKLRIDVVMHMQNIYEVR